MSLARRALARALAADAAGRAYPKPTVGAVVARDGEIVGEGVTEPAGGTARSSRSTPPATARAARRSS